MKSINFFTLTILLSSFFISCSKEKDTPQPEPQTVYVCQDSRYTGANCDQQKTPTKIWVNKIAITRFPQYKQAPNITWDGTTDIGDQRPDLQLELWKNTSSYQFGTSVVWDANYNQRYDWIQTLSNKFPFQLENSGNYYVRASDYDNGGIKEVMGEVYFTPYHNTNGFPPILYLSSNEIDVELHITYEF